MKFVYIVYQYQDDGGKEDTMAVYGTREAAAEHVQFLEKNAPIETEYYYEAWRVL